MARTKLVLEPIDVAEAKRLAKIFKALAGASRLLIISEALSHPGSRVSGAELEEVLGVTQTTISHHTRQLRTVNALRSERAGISKEHIVLLAPFQEVSDFLRSLIPRRRRKRE